MQAIKNDQIDEKIIDIISNNDRVSAHFGEELEIKLLDTGLIDYHSSKEANVNFIIKGSQCLGLGKINIILHNENILTNSLIVKKKLIQMQ